MESGVNQRIKQLRDHLKLSSNDFAQKARMSSPGLWRIENGDVTPRDKTLNDISSAFNVSMEWLKHGNGEMLLPAQPKTESGVWRDALVEHLEKEIDYLRTVVLNLSGKKSFDSAIGKAAAQFVRGTNSVSANA